MAMSAGYHFTIDVLILTLVSCALYILHKTYHHVQITGKQLSGSEDASLEVLQQSSQSSLPGLKMIRSGLWLFLFCQVLRAWESWRLVGEDAALLSHAMPLCVLLEGVALSLWTYGVILYFKVQEQYKPTQFLRPFDRIRGDSRFDERYRLVALVLVIVATITLLAAKIVQRSFNVSPELLSVFGLWRLGLLIATLSYIRWSNLPFQRQMMVTLFLWCAATFFAVFGVEVFERLLLIPVMGSLIQYLIVENIYRLSDLRMRSTKISHDKHILLTFLNQVADSGEKTGGIEGSFDIEKLAQTTLKFALEQTQATAGALFLVSENHPGELFAIAVEGSYPPQQDIVLDHVAVKQKHLADLVLSERISFGQGVVGEVASTGRPVRIEDASLDPRVHQSREEFLRIHNQLVVPLRVKDRIEGVLSVINHAGTQEFATPFDVHDEALLMAIGEQAAIILSNARMHKILAEQEILEREIQIAQEVQLLLLPKHCPVIQGFDMGAFSRSARRVGGDYYDFIWIDDHRLAIVVADVAGKGVPGALTMAMVRSALKAQVHQGRSAWDILTELNEFVYQDTKPETFVSMFLAILDTQKHSLSLARAGHEPLIYLPSGNGSCKILAPDGIALGMDSGKVFNKSLEEVEIDLKPGDTLVLYTDGITEAMNEQNEEFSLERFINALQRSRTGTSLEIVQNIQRSLSDFTGDLPQHDDLTLVLVKVQR